LAAVSAVSPGAPLAGAGSLSASYSLRPANRNCWLDTVHQLLEDEHLDIPVDRLLLAGVRGLAGR
jgi:hypothetical protein